MAAATPCPPCHRHHATRAVPERAARTLVIGLGNPLRCDDAVGMHVAARLRKVLENSADIDVLEDCCGGLRLMERLIGYQRAVIVDAARTGAPPGTVRVFSAGTATRHDSCPHDLDLPTALELGRCSGAALPEAGNMRIVTVEAADVQTFCESCTPAVAAGVSRAVETVLELLRSWR